MYCCDECHTQANRFFEKREKYQKPFAVINGIFVLLIGISIFLYSLYRDLGVILGSSSLLILGIMFFFLPFPPEVIIHKYKLKKSIFITKIIAGVVFLLGAIVLILYITRII